MDNEELFPIVRRCLGRCYFIRDSVDVVRDAGGAVMKTLYHYHRSETVTGAREVIERLWGQGFAVTDISADDGKFEIVYKANNPMEGEAA